MRRSNQIAVLSPLLVLCMSAPALAQIKLFRTYEGFATHVVDGVRLFNRIGTIVVHAEGWGAIAALSSGRRRQAVQEMRRARG